MRLKVTTTSDVNETRQRVSGIVVRRKSAMADLAHAKRVHSIVGKAVEVNCPSGGTAFGVVDSNDGGKLVVKLAIPSDDGMLMVTDSTTEVDEIDVRVVDAKVSECKVKRFDCVNVLRDCKVSFRAVRHKENPEGYNQYTGSGGTTEGQASKASGKAGKESKNADKATRAAGGNPPNTEAAQAKLSEAQAMIGSGDRASISEGHARATEGHVAMSEAHAAQAQIAISMARAGDASMMSAAVNHTQASVAHSNAAGAHADAAKLHADLDDKEKTIGNAPNACAEVRSSYGRDEEDEEDEDKSKVLPDNYRPAVSGDVPEGRACGNCAAYNESRINEDGVSVWCERWADWVRGDHYCDGWEGRDKANGKGCPKAGRKLTTVRDEDSSLGEIEDYRNVTFEGFASTFASVTAADRQGDNIVEGAFTRTIAKFMENPVMLIDHENSVHQIAGSYEKLSQTSSGLAVRGRVSDAPRLKDVRFLLAEGHLRALSIGGMFRYDVDGRTILEIELFEISLVAVPANPDALFSVRKISIDDATKAYKKFAVAGKKLQPL